MSENIIEVTTSNFESVITKSNVPVVIDFWASWCGPCRMMLPIFEEIATEMSNVKFAKVNVDDASEIAAKFRVVSIPFFAIFKNGKLVSSKIGGSTKANMIDWIEQNI